MKNDPTGAVAEGVPARPEYDAFDKLEGPIIRVRKLAEVQGLLAEAWGEGGLSERLMALAESMSFMALEVRAAADALDATWLELHNARP